MDLRLDWPPGRTSAPFRPACAMVIFGSSGDLTKRLLIPALYNLAKAGRLSDKFALIGRRPHRPVARRVPRLFSPKASAASFRHRDRPGDGRRSMPGPGISGRPDEPI